MMSRPESFRSFLDAVNIAHMTFHTWVNSRWIRVKNTSKGENDVASPRR
jgi:hypothetical protein